MPGSTGRQLSGKKGRGRDPTRGSAGRAACAQCARFPTVDSARLRTRHGVDRGADRQRRRFNVDGSLPLDGQTGFGDASRQLQHQGK